MTLDALLHDETLRNREFPVTRHKVYLAHAAVCPLPGRVVRAMVDYSLRASEEAQFEYLHREVEEQTRELAAQLLGASAEEIAFVPSTSAGLSLVAAGLEWEAGDNVVIAEGDFPANIYPWLNLQRRGVKVKFIPKKSDSAVELTDVKQQVDKRTRLVSLSSVHFANGAAIDVDAIG